MSTIKTPKMPFVNVVEMHARHPETFEIPTEEDLKILKIGSSCKISTGGERFWVDVSEIKDDGTIIGIVDNDLIFTHEHGLSADDLVSFKVENIYDCVNFCDITFSEMEMMKMRILERERKFRTFFN